jgi:hypothetical protein
VAIKEKRLNRLIIFLFLFLFLGFAGSVKGAEREYSYRFENPRFDISFLEIRLQGSGEGEMRYKKRDQDEEISVKLKLQPSTMQRLGELFNSIRLLDGSDSYQADKQLPHLGTVTLGMKVGGQGREASFNYTNNKMALKLVELFRAIENQERKLMELTLARRYSPLDLPRQLKNLESELKRDRIAEPSQFLPLLSEIALDDSLPLIARNSAEKLATQIKRRN